MSSNTVELSTSAAQLAPGFLEARCHLCGALGTMKVVLQHETKQSGTKRLLRCASCRVIFLHPQPEIAEITDDFVDRHITNDVRLLNFTSKRDPVLKRVAEHITRECAPGKHLDVGCAGGYFLDNFMPGAPWEKFGAEASRFAAAKALEKGIKIWQGMFGTLQLPENFFDVVTVLDVLYYFPQPLREFVLIRKAIKPSGVLWVECPLGEAQIWRNNSLVVRTVSRSSRSLFASNHLYYFNLASLSFLLKQSGFRIAEMYPLPPIQHPSPYSNFVYRAFAGASALLWKLSFRRIFLGPLLLIKAVPDS